MVKDKKTIELDRQFITQFVVIRRAFHLDGSGDISKNLKNVIDLQDIFTTSSAPWTTF